METQKQTAVEAKPSTALDKILSLSEIVKTNRPVIDDKVTRMKAALSAVKAVGDPKTDQYANDLLVKVAKGVTDIETLRKAYTGPINDWLKDQIIGENEVKAELDRVRGLRNAYAKKQADERKKEQDEIDKKKRFTEAEAVVKSRMKMSLETGITKKIADLEAYLADVFNKATLENVGAIKPMLEKIKFGLKEDYYTGLLDVTYSDTVLTEDDFKALKKRALDYWKFEDKNKVYVEAANETRAAWIAKLPARKKELEEIAKGGEKAAKIKADAEHRATQEAELRKREQEEQAKKIALQGQSIAQEGTINAEFNAQVAAQSIAAPASGTRTKKLYLIDATIEGEVTKVVKVLASLMLNVLTEPNPKLEGKMTIWKRDKSGQVIFREDGVPEYIEGVQYWLDEAAKIKRPIQIEGLYQTDSVSVAAKSKGK
jgi:hypothetical protein